MAILIDYSFISMTYISWQKAFVLTPNLGSVYPISTTEHKIKSIADYKMHP